MNREPLESAAEIRTVRWAQARGILVTKMAGNPSLTGWPDRCFWLPGGRPALVEFKRRGARPRKGEMLQRDRQKYLKGMKYDVLTGCVDADKAIAFLSKLINLNTTWRDNVRTR